MQQKIWKVLNEDNSKPILDKILQNRGISELEKESYLNPDFKKHQHSPFLMQNMEKAVKRIVEAIQSKQHILIFGDYDADGVTATTLLFDFFKEAGAETSYLLPHRMIDGYGITPEGVRKAQDKGANLIITVDNGISAFDAVVEANSLGIDVIITDHHKQNGDLPPAFAVINPNQKTCKYPFKGISGVGVAYKLAQAVGSEIWFPEKLEKFLRWNLDLVAMGTVADISPMVDENRVFVHFGLKVISQSKREGVRALLKITGEISENVDTATIGFKLGPRLNAAGRLEAADRALELLLTKSPQEALKIANELNEINSKRQTFTTKGLAAAELKVNLEDKMLIVCSEDWHPGVIGLIAGKLTEKYSKPSLVLTYKKEEKKYAGSGRSIESFDITNAFSQFEKLLISYGGHKQAAGLSVSRENLKEFRVKLLEFANETITLEELQPVVFIDTFIEPKDAILETFDKLKEIGPFGEGNSFPIFGMRDLLVINVRNVGLESQHIKISLRKDNRYFDCIGFGLGGNFENLRYGSFVDIAFHLDENRWNGKNNLQLRLVDIKIKE
ncbi:single-stranded-DNA-specific exonuclease RecJ [bacterium]|nr:single-stranded-DNA-specific exonuclease RecJ [bacterium]